MGCHSFSLPDIHLQNCHVLNWTSSVHPMRVLHKAHRKTKSGGKTTLRNSCVCFPLKHILSWTSEDLSNNGEEERNQMLRKSHDKKAKMQMNRSSYYTVSLLFLVNWQGLLGSKVLGWCSALGDLAMVESPLDHCFGNEHALDHLVCSRSGIKSQFRVSNRLPGDTKDWVARMQVTKSNHQHAKSS